MRWIVVMALMFATPAVADETCGTGASSAIFSIAEWSIAPVDADTNRMIEKLIYTGSKPLRMIDGSISYSDVLGDSIASKAIDRDVKIAPGDSYTQDGNWGRYTFERLLDLERQDVRVIACVRQVVYADGTIEKFD